MINSFCWFHQHVKGLAHGPLLCLLAACLAACGGSGGGEGGGSDPQPVTPSTIHGQVTVLNESGDVAPVSAGQSVQLVELNPRGEPGAVIATTNTDSAGSFQFALPPGRSPGLALGVTAGDGAGGRWRAVALNVDAPVGPASEAVTQELFSALAQAPGAVQTNPRLGDFYRNAALWLSLLRPGDTAPGPAVQRLRERMQADVAARMALAELALQGRLTSSLGDIGGLFGYTDRAIEVDDSEDGLRISHAQPATDRADEWTIDEFPSGSTATPDKVWMRLQDDGALQTRAQLLDTTAHVLLNIVGQHQVHTFRWSPGAEQVLASIRKTTDGYDFGGDRLADTLVFRLSQRQLGIETIEVLGERWRALVFETNTTLSIELSEGGSIAVQGIERRWHVPELGVVRAEQTNQATERDGRVTTGSATRVARRAVSGGTSWPGRVRFSVTELGTPTAYGFPTSLGLTAADQILVTGNLSLECCLAHRGISVRPLRGPGGRADIVAQPGLLGAQTFLSPDGRRLYVATSTYLAGDGSNVALPVEEATALGARITRYDATTLAEEVRITLPPVPSRLQPGLFFPRYLARTLLVSPSDSTHFAVAGVDAAFVRDTTVVSTLGNEADVNERLGPDGRARLLGEQIFLRGWDADRQEIRLELNGGGPLSRALPITATGIGTSAMRTSAPALFSLWPAGGTAALYDHVDSHRLYLDSFRKALHPDTGVLIADLGAQPDLALRLARCTRRMTQVVCLESSRIHLLDTNLQTQRTLALQPDLRRLVGGATPAAPNGPLHAASDGSLVYIAETYGSNWPLADLVAYRLVFD